MTIGLTIPGVKTVHARETWVETCYPMQGPRQVMANVHQPVIHYSSALNLPDGDIGEFEWQVLNYIRASNRDYWLNRKSTGITVCGKFLPGYALGYMFWVDWLGGVWEVRGFDLKAAANAPTNDWTFPVMMVTDRYDKASELAWASARAIFREARRRSGRSDFKNRPLGHRELPQAATACPGDAVLGQLHEGYGDLDYEERHNNMIPFKKAIRVFDSREEWQHLVDDMFQPINNALGPLFPGQSRRIFVGLAAYAEVIIHSVGHGEAGFLQVSGDSVPPSSSLINFDGSDRVEDNSQCIALTDGSIWVTAGPATTDFIVEVSALW